MRCDRCKEEAVTKINSRYFRTENVCLACARVVLGDRQCDNIPQPPQPTGLIDQVNKYRAENAKKNGLHNERSNPLIVLSPEKPIHAFFSLKRFHEVGSTPQGGGSYVNVYRDAKGQEVLANLVSETPDHYQTFDDVEDRGLVVEYVRQIGYHEVIQMLRNNQETQENKQPG